MFDRLTDIGTLFPRCGSGGISGAALESVAAKGIDIAAPVLFDLLRQFKEEA